MIPFTFKTFDRVRVGDVVICRGLYGSVHEVRLYEEYQHREGPIRLDFPAVQVITLHGCRWGAPHTRINIYDISLDRLTIGGDVR